MAIIQTEPTTPGEIKAEFERASRAYKDAYAHAGGTMNDELGQAQAGLLKAWRAQCRITGAKDDPAAMTALLKDTVKGIELVEKVALEPESRGAARAIAAALPLPSAQAAPAPAASAAAVATGGDKKPDAASTPIAGKDPLQTAAAEIGAFYKQGQTAALQPLLKNALAMKGGKDFYLSNEVGKMLLSEIEQARKAPPTLESDAKLQSAKAAFAILARADEIVLAKAQNKQDLPKVANLDAYHALQNEPRFHPTEQKADKAPAATDDRHGAPDRPVADKKSHKADKKVAHHEALQPYPKSEFKGFEKGDEKDIYRRAMEALKCRDVTTASNGGALKTLGELAPPAPAGNKPIECNKER